jgi:predicted dehydrogenase
MAHQIRWGVLGCARIARTQMIPGIQRCAKAKLEAAGSRDAGKLKECLELFGHFSAHAMAAISPAKTSGNAAGSLA